MLPNENLDTKNLNLTLYLFDPKNGEYYNQRRKVPKQASYRAVRFWLW